MLADRFGRTGAAAWLIGLPRSGITFIVTACVLWIAADENGPMAHCKAFLSLCILARLAFGQCPAMAADGDPKFEIQLGDVPHYATEAEAKAACGKDGVVWADRKTGFFYPKFFQDYGTTRYGTYTCHKLAVKADYWSFAPVEEGGKGRTFPQFFCGPCF